MSRRPSRKQAGPGDRRSSGASLPGSPKIPQGPTARQRVSSGTTAAARQPASPPSPPRQAFAALTLLDWIALTLLAIALGIAPLFAGTFAMPPRTPSVQPAGAFDALSLVGMPLAVLLVAIAGGVAAGREWPRLESVRNMPALSGAAILMGLWAVLSLAHTRALAMSLDTLAALLAALLLGGLAARLSRDPRARDTLLMTVVAAAGIVALLGIREYVQQYQAHDVTHRTFATFVNPDFLAGYLLLALPVTLSAFAAAREGIGQFVTILSLAAQSACLLLTGSRAGVGILLAALLAWLALVVVSGAARGRWGRIGVGLAVFALATVLASAPTRARVSALHIIKPNPAAPSRPVQAAGADTTAVGANLAAAQGYSAEFRRYTWIGTLRMTLANPLIGAGIGTFEVSYPHYALTAYTAHAHNSYLQWASETGLPGLSFLLVFLAAVFSLGARALLRSRRAFAPDETTRAVPQEATLFDRPSLLLAGLLAGAVASLLHSLFDSDWYIVATLFTLSAVLGLLVAMARAVEPAPQTAADDSGATSKRGFRPVTLEGETQPLAHAMTVAGIVLALFLLWQALSTGIAAIDMASGAQALTDNDPQGAISSYQQAASADPLDPEAYLDLGMLYKGMQRPDDARKQFEEATRVAQIGKTFYRLGLFDASAGDFQGAIRAFEHAREIEPRNLQTLHELADAYNSAGDPQHAAQVYAQMTALENAPYGKVRAIPTLIETEFAYAHAGLADIAYAQGRWAEAAQEYARAAAVLKTYWDGRWLEAYVTVPVQKRTAWADLYDRVLTRWQDSLKKLGPGQAAEVARVEAELTQLRKERAAGS
ncbi:MAG TPA: tetratricopeptide repeat protein [Chthonomonadaceae bacterium]|nr:tetratricopeptide repeat protein [Chthonomonadaceae bacterium]